MVTILRRGFFQVFFENKAKKAQNFGFLLALGSNIAAFFTFLHPKTYRKVWAKSVIRSS